MSALIALALAAAPALRVVVYPDRAQVTRAAAAVCGNGSASVNFDGLTPAAEQASFRALSPDASVLGVRSQQLAHVDELAPEAKQVAGAIRALQADARRLEDALGRSRQQARVAASYADVASQIIGREMVQPAVDPAGWDKALGAALDARIKANAEQVKTAAELREVQARLAELLARRNLLQASMQRLSWKVEVLLGCDQGQTVHAELSYLVGAAGWEPLYEARADEKAGKVELSMFATVRQATGEDWKRAQIVLSTAIPRSDATPPEVATLRVGALERKAEKKVLVRRDEEQKHAEAAAGDADEGGGGGMQAAAQGLSVQLRVQELADLVGDGTPARLFVGAHKLAARFAYRTIPRLMPYVFRVADLVNSAPFPLLPGQLDAYRTSGFIARTPLERVAEGAKFHLTFGVEEGIRVKRLVLEELQRDAGLFGQNKRFHYSYRFELTSHLRRPEQIELGDHLPVSELDDVHVELDGKTSSPREVGKDDGLVTWKLELPPGATRLVDLAFHVDVPGSYDSGGL